MKNVVNGCEVCFSCYNICNSKNLKSIICNAIYLAEFLARRLYSCFIFTLISELTMKQHLCSTINISLLKKEKKIRHHFTKENYLIKRIF